MPGNANLWKEYLAADIPGRAIYAIDGLLGNLWRSLTVTEMEAMLAYDDTPSDVRRKLR